MSITVSVTLTPSLPDKLERTIERLIDLLDALERNSDDEDGGDSEHSFGWQNEGSQRTLQWVNGDSEPDLGFVGHGTGWRDGESIDDTREYDPADERQRDDAEFAPCL